MQTFTAFRVEKSGDSTTRAVQEVGFDTLPAADVTVQVHYSSLNYKDALSAEGHPGVSRTFPHTPGIDAAGVVEASKDARFAAGDEVIVTSYDLGMNTPGGFGGYIRVPGDWVVKKPADLSLRESMMLGTAGFTAAMAVAALLRIGLTPDDAPVLVTGATGGVGSIAVMLLAKLGFEVVASTGKESAHAWLKERGATSIIARQELEEANPRAMLKARFAGAVDTVGGHTLENVLKSLQQGGAVAACGNVGGPELNLTVFPFILRGANLLGVDSGNLPLSPRQALWERLAGDWRLTGLESITEEITLEGLEAAITTILRGGVQGRTLVRLQG